MYHFANKVVPNIHLKIILKEEKSAFCKHMPHIEKIDIFLEKVLLRDAVNCDFGGFD